MTINPALGGFAVVIILLSSFYTSLHVGGPLRLVLVGTYLTLGPVAVLSYLLHLSRR